MWINLSDEDQQALSAMCNDEASAEQRERVLTRLVQFQNAGNPKYVEAARQQYNRDGEIEIDDSAVVSDSDEGAYVMAWVWVYRSDAIPDDVECGNCAWAGLEAELNPIKDLTQRVEAGEDVPAGECPECGALAYKIEEDQ